MILGKNQPVFLYVNVILFFSFFNKIDWLMAQRQFLNLEFKIVFFFGK